VLSRGKKRILIPSVHKSEHTLVSKKRKGKRKEKRFLTAKVELER